MSTYSKQIAKLKSHIRDIPDFPKPGIIFKDITPLLSNPPAFKMVVDMLADRLSGLEVDFIACPEARGFILAAPLAYQLGAGITLIRKSGKLPADTIDHTFDLEYASDTLSIHTDAFASRPNPSVLIVDDVLATGGTARATAELITAAGGKVTGVAVLIELDFLDGRSRLAGLPVTSLLNY